MGFGQPRVTEPGPMQVRIFQGSAPEDLEVRVNRWLAEDARREIVEVRQNAVTLNGAVEIVVSVWYLDS